MNSGGPDRERENGPGGTAFWVAVAAGWGMIAFAVRGLLRAPDWAANPDGFGRFLLTSVLVHDLLLAPAACAAGLLVARVVPARIRPAVSGGLVASAVVVLVAWPFVRGYGRAPTNPSALPWNYARSLLLVLGAVWLAAGIAALWRLRRPPA